MSASSENSLPPTHAATASSPNSPANSMARNLRIAGILLLCGLLVTIASLIWKAPLSFLMFAGIGCLLVFLGVVFYLLSLLPSPPKPPSCFAATCPSGSFYLRLATTPQRPVIPKPNGFQ